MEQIVTREDIDDILQAFAESHFARLRLSAGSVRIAVNRYPAEQERPVASHITEVVAPMLGTFQSSPEAGAPALVRVGSTVQPETAVGMIRVMQNLTPVKAGLNGTILEVLVQDGQLVEFGQPLLRIGTESASSSG